MITEAPKIQAACIKAKITKITNHEEDMEIEIENLMIPQGKIIIYVPHGNFLDEGDEIELSIDIPTSND